MGAIEDRILSGLKREYLVRFRSCRDWRTCHIQNFYQPGRKNCCLHLGRVCAQETHACRCICPDPPLIDCCSDHGLQDPQFGNQVSEANGELALWVSDSGTGADRATHGDLQRSSQRFAALLGGWLPKGLLVQPGGMWLQPPFR